MRNLPLTNATFGEHDPSVAEKDAIGNSSPEYVGGQPPQGVFFRPSSAWHALLWAGRVGGLRPCRCLRSGLLPTRFRPPVSSGRGLSIRNVGGNNA